MRDWERFKATVGQGGHNTRMAFFSRFSASATPTASTSPSGTPAANASSTTSVTENKTGEELLVESYLILAAHRSWQQNGHHQRVWVRRGSKTLQPGLLHLRREEGRRITTEPLEMLK